MRRRGLEPMHDEHVNVTPLIDVVMCLIIFFLCCSTLAKEETNEQVQIPRAQLGQTMADQRGRLVINLVPRGRDHGAGSESLTTPAAPVRGNEEPDLFVGSQKI